MPVVNSTSANNTTSAAISKYFEISNDKIIPVVVDVVDAVIARTSMNVFDLTTSDAGSAAGLV